MLRRHLLKVSFIGLVALLCISGQVLRKELFPAPSAQTPKKAESKEHVAGGHKSAAYRAMEPHKEEKKHVTPVVSEEGERKSAARKLIEGHVAKSSKPVETRARVSIQKEAVAERKSAARKAMERTSDASAKSAARKAMEEVYRD